MKPLHPSIQTEAEAIVRANPALLVSVVDVHGRRYFISPAHTELLGYDPGELVGHHYSETVPPIDLAHVRVAQADAELTGENTPVTITMRHKTGGMVQIRGTGRRVTDPETGEVFFLTICSVI